MKTVSWYLHSLQYRGYLVIITPERVQKHMSFGTALREYGPMYVQCAVVTEDTITLLLY